jgi:hypothetical protein
MQPHHPRVLRRGHGIAFGAHMRDLEGKEEEAEEWINPACLW